MRLLILGGDGMLGHRARAMLHTRFETFVTFRSLPTSSLSHPAFSGLDERLIRLGVDAQNIESVATVVEELRPTIVLNCIGVIKQRQEGKDAIPLIQVNALFPHLLGKICEVNGSRLIHLSTDCVFSGNRGNYSEKDNPDPVDLYGRSKLLGEVTGTGCLTLRTSIIGWELKNRAGLLEWFASQRGRTIKGYRGAIYTGLSTSTFARLLGKLIDEEPALNGLYQVASESITKYDLLMRLREVLGWEDITILPDDEFQCDRSLIGQSFKAITGYLAPAWDEMIAELATEWPEYERWRKSV